jgi:restriction system protein
MWEYNEAGRLMTIKSVYSDDCIYCQASMFRIPAEKFEVGSKTLFVQLSICQLCGWWSVYRIHQSEYPRTAGIIESHSGTIGCLKELDLSDVSTPLDQVRQYLLAKSESIFDTHPKLFEDVVCSIFKDCGYRARVTAYSGDDGIDVILDSPSGETIGVQVKRYKKERRIEAEQIRSLAGALLVGGHTKGIFVTTSTFRRGARKMANKLSSIGYPMKLIDAERFLNALGIAQINSFEFDRERMISYCLAPGVHLGSGLNKDLTPGEDLRKREIVGSALLGQEFIDLYGDGTYRSMAKDAE